MKKESFMYKQRYLIGILVLSIMWPTTALCAQGDICLKGRYTLKEAIEHIEKTNGYTFFYKDNDLKDNAKRDVNCEGTIDEVLKVLFKDSNVNYVIQGKEIIFKVNEKHAIEQQRGNRTVTGIVTDAQDGSPIIGASIMLKGTTTGVITDVNGHYSIQIPTQRSAILSISYLGYKTKEIAVGDLGVINVSLSTDNQVLDEVVVVGAGTQKKVSVTGAISSISGATIKAPSSSLTANFAGKLSGVIAMTQSGEPGTTSDFYIRGVSTFGGRATPLILLDDIEISAEDLNNIPAESIESFSILKDASATAIYGARGANGVMLVTTKNGVENSRTKVNISLECSALKPTKRMEYADGPTFMELYNEATIARTPTATPKYSAEKIENTRKGVNPYIYPNVDWYDLLFKDQTSSQRANINVQGGGSRVTYYMGLQVNHDNGMFDVPKSSDLNSNVRIWKYVFQNNIAYKLTPTTTIDLRMNVQIGNRKGTNVSTSDVFYKTWEVDPVSFPAYFPAESGDTHIKFGNAILRGSSRYYNPYAYMLDGDSEKNSNTLNTSLRLKQKLDFLLKGLSVSTLINWKSYAYSTFSRSYAPYYYRVKEGSYDPTNPTTYELEQVGKAGEEYISQSSPSTYHDNTFYFDARVNYDHRFGDHNVGAMLMYMMREYRIPSQSLPYRNQGFSGRATYDYKGRYLAEFNFGYNGTERLPKGSRFEFFPALSLGWVISGEDFWKPMENIVSFLKVRGSYGLVGSDETGSGYTDRFLYLNHVSLYGGGDFLTGARGEVSRSGPWFGVMAVADPHWERVKKFDVGVDIELFNQLNIVFDYFHDKRDRILMARASWPMIFAGASMEQRPWSNIGKVDNKGFELSVKWNTRIGKSLYADLRANMTYNKNKYVYKDEPDYPYVWQKLTGKPLSCTIGYIAEGLFTDQEEIDNSPSQSSLGSAATMPGDIKYRDVNGDNVITYEDQVMISPYGKTPRLQYGFGLNLSYKKWDFGVFFNGSAKRTLMLNGLDPFEESSDTGPHNVMQWIADSHWSESNPDPDANYPRLGLLSKQIAGNKHSSTFWMRDGSFLRFKTLELGYTFPHCRVYFSGDNIAVWSPFKLWDPELSWNSYPMSRTFNLGLQINF